MADALAYECPACGQAVALTPLVEAQSITCPHCGGEFLVEASPAALEQVAQQDDDAISARRIRQISSERRSLHRMRSYFIIAAAACAIATLQLALMAFERLKPGRWDRRAIGYSIFAFVAFLGAGMFGQHARDMHREAKRSKIAEDAPTPPPPASHTEESASSSHER